MGGHRLRFGEDMPGTYPKSVKSVFVSEQGHSAGADPGFFLGGGAPLRNDVTDR